MAVYKEIDGKLVLVEEDLSQAALHQQVQQQREEKGLPTSSCIKDSLTQTQPTEE